MGTIDEIVDIVNDAYPFPDSINVNSVHLIGYVVSQGINVTPIDYGVVLKCNQPVLEDTITNTGSIPAIIYNIALEPGADASAFVIPPVFPDTIAPGTFKTYKVVFKPNRTGNFSATAKVFASTDSAHIIQIVGKVYTVPIELFLKKYTANDLLKPSNVITLDVSIKNDKPDDADITSIQMEIVYNSSWLSYINKVDPGDALDKTWAVNATEVRIDNKMSKLIITGNGSTPIKKTAAVLFVPQFLLLLTNENTLIPTVGAITTGVRDSCVVRTGNPGQIVVTTCAFDIRDVLFSGTQYALHEIEPNPITGSSFDLKYDVGLKGQTRVEIVNTSGQLVKVVCDEDKEVGKYTQSISTAELSSGVYLIRMVSGPFSNIQRLVITK